MGSLKIQSVNCQGLGNLSKRRDVFDFLKSERYNIYCLQDTHFTQEQENDICSMWGDNCYFSSFSSNSRGVAILINSNFDYKVLREKKDLSGNFLALDIIVDNVRLTLVTVYGPNTDSPSFYEQIMLLIDDFENESYIVCGDFNLVLSPELDYCDYLNVNNPNARDKLLELIEYRSLIDPFRELHPDLRRYTWRKKNPLKQARLDFFLFTDDMLPYLKKCCIETSYRSDHSRILLDLELSPFVRGKGLWKFNNSLLYDIQYITLVKEKIAEIRRQYAALPYDLDNLDHVDNDLVQFTINDQLFLEVLLMEIRGKTISYSSFKKKERVDREKVLHREIQVIEEDLDNASVDLLDRKRLELENLRKEKLNGKMIRSRAQWIEEGEKPTNYFCGLESKNFTNKIIPKVQIDDGKIISNQNEILNQVKIFYENLYKCNNVSTNCTISEINTGLKDVNVKKLRYEEQENLEGTISVSEAGEVLKNMKSNKTPGTDGFSSEFFKFFWKDLKHFVVRSINYGYQKGELSVTQKQGVITCLPKGNKPKHFLKNWRPISLLNTVYKICSGVIAKRVKSVLNKLIDTDQTGFISGRYIGENLRLIYDIMQYTEENNIPGVLLLIDFEKAFDSISWEFLNITLKFFNFGESIQKWVKVLYKNINSAVIQAGNLSPFFEIGRGCRQGDPLSPYLFILCAEIMGLKIRNNRKISGIKVTQIEHKLSQFADDTSLILDGTEESLRESLCDLDWFGKVSGLNINFSKTQVVWIGSQKYSDQELCQERKLSWGSTSFKLLGIHFDVDLGKMTKINYKDGIQKIKSIINQWSKRNITVIGKITVVKTLMLPILNHLIMSLPNPDTETIKYINSLFYTFIWNSPVHRVKIDVLEMNYEDGGLKMININNFIAAMKCTWVRRLYNSNSKWQNIFMSQVDKDKFFSYGDEFIKQLKIKTVNRFWQDVLESLLLLIEKEQNQDWSYFLASPIWMNSIFKIDNKPFIYQDLLSKGIKYINDIVDEDGLFLKYVDFCNIFNINVSIMQYNSIISCVTQSGKQVCKQSFKLSSPFIPSVVRTILKSSKGSKEIYSVLNNKSCIPTGIVRWNDILNVDKEISWRKLCKLPFIVTKNSKLQWLQYRIIHRIISTNKFLYKINKASNTLCTFCKKDEETIEHLFWYCECVQKFIDAIDVWFLENGISILFSKENFLFGNPSHVYKGNPENNILLWIKQFIYNAKIFNTALNIPGIKEKLKYMYNLEKIIAVKNENLDKFDQLWNIYDFLT